VRIIAGSRKGHRIEAPRGLTTRPTSDFVRETAFNLIGPVDGANVLELFAGSGALALEALSRGAARATIVDSDRAACRAINANLDKLKLHATVLCQDALRAVSTDTASYDGLDRLAPHLKRLLAAEGLLVLQTAARDEPAVEGLAVRTSRKYGSARLTLLEP
jgi:16S rRNA (guanine(966)-N(2))-methyltransferase RsmD